MLKTTPKKRVLFVRRLLPVLLALFGVFSYLAINVNAPKLAYASAADTVNFQARLQNSSGAIVPDGYYNVEFKLYNGQGSASNPGTCSTSDCVWMEDYTGANKLEVKDGYLSAPLGSITPFNTYTNIDWSQQLYLTMDIGGTTSTVSWDGEMAPRLAFTSTPYAFQAGQAAQADELSKTSGSNTATLSIQAPTSGNETFVLQDQGGTGGTYDILTTQAADGDFIQLNPGTQQSGNIDISGSVTAGSIDTGALDTASAGSVSIGGGNATSISLGNTTSNIATTINGTVTVKPTTGHDSTTAFQIQNAASQDLIQVDTTSNNIILGGNNSGALQPWVANSTTIPTASYAAVTAISNGYVYYVGGSTGTSGTLSSVNYAPLNANGSVGNWTTSSNSLPAALSNAAGFAANGYLYVIGGSTTDVPSGAVSTVYYAKLNADGSVGAWHTNSNALPTTAFAASGTTANGYVYIIGGVNSLSTRLNSVYYAPINADGSIGSWATSSNVLPATLDAGAVVTANGYLYYTGGYDGSNSSKTTYYTSLNLDGSIGSWTADPHQISPNGMTSLGLAVENGYLYVIGGAASTFNVNTIQYVPLTTSGALGGNWVTDTNTLPANLAGMNSVVTDNGYIYFLGGATNNAGTSTTNNIYYSSTQRIQLGGSIDLVGLANQSLNSPGTISNGSAGGSITAGNITAVGMLQVQGQATFSQSVSADGNLSIGGSANFQNSTNSSAAFQVQSTSGTSVLNVDTTDGRVGVDGGSPTATLDVQNTSGNSTVLNVGDSNSFNALTVDNSDTVSLGKAPSGVVGNDSAFGGGGSDYGLETAQKFTTSSVQSGSISSMSVYLHSGVTSGALGQLAIYSDTTSGCAMGTDCPYQLVASSAQATLTGDAWNTMSISATLSPNTTYWFAYWENDATQSEQGLNTSSYTGLPFAFGSATFGSSMPSTFPSLTYDNASTEASIYATFANNGSQLTADASSNTIQLGYDTGLYLQGAASYISDSQGQLDSEAFGYAASVSGTYATALGNSAGATGGGTAVGYNAQAGNNGISFGAGAISGAGAVAMGYEAQAATGSIAIGYQANAYGPGTYTGSIAIGMNTSTTAANQMVIGGPNSSGWNIKDVYIGSGATDTAPQSVTIHATGGSGTNVQGANISIAGGTGTGTAAGGNINFQTAAPSATSGSTANSLSTVESLSGANGAATFQNSANSTNGFQVKNASGAATIFNVDTSDQQVTMTQDSSSTASPVMTLTQGGSGDSTLALENSTASSSFYISNDADNGNSFTVNSYTAAISGSGTATPMEVQASSTASSASASSTSLAFTSNNTAGNTIVVAASWQATGLTPTCSDSQGNAYSTIVTKADATNDSQSGICYATNIKAGANTVTVTYGASETYRSLAIQEYSGIATTSPVDTSISNTATGTTSTNGYTSTTSVTGTSGDLIFGFFTDETGNSATATAGTGFTVRTNNTALTSPVTTEDMVQTSAGSIAATQTENAADEYVGMMMAFRPASTGSLTDTNASSILTITQTGQTTFRNSNNSTTAFQIQNSASLDMFSVDTSDSLITIGGSSTTFATLDLNNAHFESTQTNPPTAGTLTNCGSSTLTFTSGDTDNAGSFYMTGAGTPASTCSVQVKFNQAFSSAPKSVVMQVTNSVASATGTLTPIVSSTSSSSFTFTFSGTPAAGTEYAFYYWVIQ
jgi:hypothetical protein